jgi:hypothetical protein
MTDRERLKTDAALEKVSVEEAVARGPLAGAEAIARGRVDAGYATVRTEHVSLLLAEVDSLRLKLAHVDAMAETAVELTGEELDEVVGDLAPTVRPPPSRIEVAVDAAGFRYRVGWGVWSRPLGVILREIRGEPEV